MAADSSPADAPGPPGSTAPVPGPTGGVGHGELRPLLGLAGPVVAAELGWMTMWVVDTMMVGRVGAEAIGAVSVGGHLFFTLALFGRGFLYGLDYLVAHAWGGGRPRDAVRALAHALGLCVVLAAVIGAVLFALVPRLDLLGLDPAVVPPTERYLSAVTWSLLPLLIFTALRRYLQAIGAVRVIVFALVSANLVNAATDWVLVFGNLGAPELGAAGAGWATFASRVYMVVVLAAATRVSVREQGLLGGGPAARDPSTPPARSGLDPVLLGRLLRLGGPAAVQTLLEVSAFALGTVLAGRLSASALAAHQISLSIAATAFMVPLGLGSAAAVRVGQALGRGAPAAARAAGWTALTLSGAFAIGSAALMVGARLPLLRAFTVDPGVIAVGSQLMIVVAIFQIPDGLQATATGVLRGAGDTRSAMVANLGGHWVLGIPVGAALAFAADLGIVGLWVGFATGLGSVAVALLATWVRTASRLRADGGLG